MEAKELVRQYNAGKRNFERADLTRALWGRDQPEWGWPELCRAALGWAVWGQPEPCPATWGLPTRGQPEPCQPGRGKCGTWTAFLGGDARTRTGNHARRHEAPMNTSGSHGSWPPTVGGVNCDRQPRSVGGARAARWAHPGAAGRRRSGAGADESENRVRVEFTQVKAMAFGLAMPARTAATGGSGLSTPDGKLDIGRWLSSSETGGQWQRARRL